MNEFLKYLRKSLENQRGRKAEDECEKILGLNGRVNDFAAFYEKHEEDILVFTAAALHKWEGEREFNKEELAIYRLGLTEMAVFMEKCLTERDRKFAEEIKSRQLFAEQTADGT